MPVVAAAEGAARDCGAEVRGGVTSAGGRHVQDGAGDSLLGGGWNCGHGAWILESDKLQL